MIEANDLEAPYDIYAGQRLRVPDGNVVVASVDPEPAEPEPTTVIETVKPVTAAIAEPVPDGELRFTWPVDGVLLSSYGAKSDGLHNDGINIAAPAGTPVHAAEDGVVAYAGDEIRGYGNMVLIRHADGWVTAYAHNAQNLVSRGQTVLRGDVIASVGASGGLSQPQSHFELRQGTEAVDPIPYLN
ncbi:MAG: M23 family metallopeptidase [Rhodospirillales bacterium]|nr:M23 family metallopeptidase [Rhodospirillales bacterium]